MTDAASTELTSLLERSEPFLVDFDPLKALSGAERRRRLDGYLSFLRRRDGEPDLAGKTLSRREELFRELDRHPVRWAGSLDRAKFREYIDTPPPPDLDPKVIWLLAAAKSNRVEHYGVTLDLALKGESFASHSHGQHMTYIDLEEFYHTRILRDCCRCFDLEFDLHPPASFTRYFASLVVRSPFKLRVMTALCGELFGCVAFQVLWERADLFEDEPEVMERLRLLTREILIDEMGHTAFGNAMLGPAGIAAARALAPMVAAHFLRDLPEFYMLAGGRRAFVARVNAFDLGRNRELWRSA